MSKTAPPKLLLIDFEALRPTAANHAFSLTGNTADADDLVQRTFLRMCNSIETYDTTKKAKNWMLRIMFRIFLDMQRDAGRRPRTESYDQPVSVEDGELYVEYADHSPNPEQQLLSKEGENLLRKIIYRVTPTNAQALLLIEGEEMEYEDVAEILGIPVGTVRSRVHRAKLILQKAHRNNPRLFAGLVPAA